MSKLELTLTKMEKAKSPASSKSSSNTSWAECSRAKVAANDAWKLALAYAKKEYLPWYQKCIDGKINSCVGRQETITDIKRAKVGRIRAALAATVQGAVKLRDKAKAVKYNPKDPNVAKAKAASMAAFEACKDVSP